MSAASDQPLQNYFDKGLVYCRVRHCVQCIFKTNRGMAPGSGRRRGVASIHLVCASCSSWIQFDSSGCDTAWADTRGVASLLLARGARGWSS